MLTAAFDSFHLASAVQAQHLQRVVLQKEGDRRQQSQDDADAPAGGVRTVTPSCHHVRTIFLSSKAGRRSRKPAEGQVSLSHTGRPMSPAMARAERTAYPAARLKCP